MAKPILYAVSAFDATTKKSIKCRWEGILPCTLSLIIYEIGLNNATVFTQDYDTTTTTTELIIPANSLNNDGLYGAYAIATDDEDNVSAKSNIIELQCYLQPEFTITVDGDATNYESSTIEVSVELSSTTDTFKTIRYYLTDSKLNLIMLSDEIDYETSSDKNYKFTGLTNQSNYKVYAKCVTSQGYELQSETIDVYINYETSNYGGQAKMTNKISDGYVECKTDYSVIQYSGSTTFNYDGSSIDLTDGEILYYDEGFVVNGNFKICIRGTNFSEGRIFSLGTNKNGLKLYLYYYDDEVVGGYKLSLLVTYKNYNYTIHSDRFDMDDSSIYQIWVTNKNGVYGVELITETE